MKLLKAIFRNEMLREAATTVAFMFTMMGTIWFVLVVWS
jgi:hypothetical protein